MKHKTWIIGAVLLVWGVLALAVGGTAWAAEASPPRLLRGRVVEVGDGSLTVQTKGDEFEVLTTEETVFRVPGVANASLSDVHVGNLVLIGTRVAEGDIVTARIVVVQADRRLDRYFVRGIVTTVGDDQVSVDTASGAVATLLITDTTRMWVPDEPLTTTVTLEVGDPVLALGEPASDEAGERALSARLVVVADDETLPKILIRGQAVAVTEQTIVVQAGHRERAVTVMPRTRLLSAQGQLDSLRDVHPGAQIIALGQATELGQWIAGLVLVPGPPSLARQGLRGEVVDKDVEAGTLTVETERRGEITVVVNDETRYRIPGVEEPGFADVQVGETVVALGRFEGDDQSTFLARGIGVIPAPPENEQS